MTQWIQSVTEFHRRAIRHSLGWNNKKYCEPLKQLVHVITEVASGLGFNMYNHIFHHCVPSRSLDFVKFQIIVTSTN